MYKRIQRGLCVSIILLLGTLLLCGSAVAAEKKVLTLQDIMKFREIHDPLISEDGEWIAYSAQPDRGDGEVKIHSIKDGRVYTVDRGEMPVISKNSRWVAMAVKPKAMELEKKTKEKPKQGTALLETITGKIVNFEKVEKFSFSDDSEWIAFLHFKEEEKPEKKETSGEEVKTSDVKKESEKKKKAGSTLVLRHLNSGKETQLPHVISFTFDRSSQFLAYSVYSPDGKENGVYFIDLKAEDLPRKAIGTKEDGEFTALTWEEKKSNLAFISDSSLWIWEGKLKKLFQAVSKTNLPERLEIPGKNEVTWSKDGKRLFFGIKPKSPDEEEKEKEEGELREEDLFAVEKILEKREVDVWHWNDPFILPHQKKLWPRIKDQTYLAVFHLDSNRLVQLADEGMPVVKIPENSQYAIGLSDVPYRKEVTWDGTYNDVYLVDLKKGEKVQIASRLSETPSISPKGRFVVYYNEKHWYLVDTFQERVKNLTHQLNVPFFDEDHDYPSQPPSYGIAGWMDDESAVLIYDKYDIWKFPAGAGKPAILTGGKGRENSITYRIIRLDAEKKFFEKDETLLLSSYHDLEKHFGFFVCSVGKPELGSLLEEKKRFVFLGKAKKADVLMYTRESFEEFPDIWVSDLKFTSPKKISDVNPQIKDFIWGKAELVEWTSPDGVPLQGVLIKPENYTPGKQYPVIVYFYQLFSQRLYEYNQTVVNHRPCFPFYASNGYCIFLPDIRFEVGRPGYSATQCLVSGVQRLIGIGVADPNAIGLHGHSWSGYETAFVITQTDIFAAAIAGAPVANMTSAYGGIRWESGQARQFQYEKTQSRIGGSLWEFPERYMENSPLFFADLIQTPLLIMFGDEDGAVPWYQGIELYLALRRLGKDCIFLQYRGEPHHLQKYPNKLDYSIKMKEYFDHYLRRMPAPEWVTKGVPYRGK